MSQRANWTFPTSIRCGTDRIAELAEACRAAGIARPLLATDRVLAANKITDNALTHLDADGLGRPPTEDHVAAAAAYLGIGGGFDGFLERVIALRAEAEMPKSLGAPGIDRTHVDQSTRMALNDPSAAGNPVPVTENTARSILLDAL
ncbi:MAG: hypothetical protein AAGF59_12610 [Pseudomonadota bacterium]